MSSTFDVANMTGEEFVEADLSHGMTTLGEGENDRWMYAGDGASHKILDMEEELEQQKARYEEYKTRMAERTFGERMRDIVPCISRAPPAPLNDSSEHHGILGQFKATAIAGNDITSSALYVAAICALAAGMWAPICLMMVTIVLFLFRNIYGQVVTAIPLNGGSYNALLNTTSKTVAALAACLTILSYVATAVVSATSGMTYLNQMVPDIPVSAAVVVLLFIFAVLNLIGVSESAGVALAIFLLHIFTLTLVVAASIYQASNNIYHNWDSPEEILYLQNYASEDNSGYQVPKKIFFGFAAAFLGVSGFESSANYVEEQKKGVFVKTLRNMWYLVSFFNVVIGVLSFAVLDRSIILNPKESNALLAHMGQASGGKWLNYFVSADAAIVLSGAVLTSYVGVGGLVRRMALDRLLPTFLVQENPCRHTAHWVILGFFLICSSLYFICQGKIDELANVYSLAFLSVMFLFNFAGVLFKYKRSRLPSEVHATWMALLIAAIGVLTGLIGTVISNLKSLQFFVIYMGVVILVVGTMVFRVSLLKWLYFAVAQSRSWPYFYAVTSALTRFVRWITRSVLAQRVIVFGSSANPAKLNKLLLYVRDNEQTDGVYIVHFYENEDDIDPKFEQVVRFLDSCFPKLRVDLVLIKGKFSPAMVKGAARRLGVPLNLCFLACPKDHFPASLASYSGIRIVTH